MANLRFNNDRYQSAVNELAETAEPVELQQFIENEINRRTKLIKKADESFLNSILSFAIYEQNSWMFENLNNEISEMGSAFEQAIKNKDKMYELKIWHFMKNTFKKISENEFNIPANGEFNTIYGYTTDYNFKDGQYSAANGLAHASILKSKHPKGKGEILHLTFRGTEFSKLLKYIKGPYLDMSAYYQNFSPLIEKLRAYVSDPNNNISEIQVSGHSLGGAMVQEFLKHNPPKSFSVPIKGLLLAHQVRKKNGIINLLL